MLQTVLTRTPRLTPLHEGFYVQLLYLRTSPKKLTSLPLTAHRRSEERAVRTGCPGAFVPWEPRSADLRVPLPDSSRRVALGSRSYTPHLSRIARNVLESSFL